MHFQIMFPGKMTNAAACLRSVGLADFVDGVNECAVTMRDGVPDGLLLNWSGEIGYFPDRQRWIEGPGYQIGFWTDSPCAPADLARPSLFPGYEIELGDGHKWRVPCAADLPTTLRMVDSQWRKVRKPKFNEFWQQSEPWFRRLLVMDLDENKMASDAGRTAEQMLTEWAEYCVVSLRQNYRLTSEIASELGILDSDSLLSITMASVDGMNIKAVIAELAELREKESAGVKKKEAVAGIPD
ncbi:hypothetical protein [Schlesneria sp.]|uniref:hypothetical protein n=1 Tax=Schlesneria sp. TaxID=2762018 RepID=UPI002F0220B8